MATSTWLQRQPGTACLGEPEQCQPPQITPITLRLQPKYEIPQPLRSELTPPPGLASVLGRNLKRCAQCKKPLPDIEKSFSGFNPDARTKLTFRDQPGAERSPKLCGKNNEWDPDHASSKIEQELPNFEGQMRALTRPNNPPSKSNQTTLQLGIKLALQRGSTVTSLLWSPSASATLNIQTKRLMKQQDSVPPTPDNAKLFTTDAFSVRANINADKDWISRLLPSSLMMRAPPTSVQTQLTIDRKTNASIHLHHRLLLSAPATDAAHQVPAAS